MNTTQIGLVSGLLLGLAATQGFGAFLITLVLGFIGLVVGRMLDGELDLSQVLSGAKGKDR
ncbi:hypothetical protein SAMN05192558_110326 [Actinokineospora alba]|uniref:Small integral membrane protein n=1 Tax=Actinokineospora alba TaxID=504798 RepID=A0A1H0U1Q1_9PSEU|nr:hypothetical protein [Actinokineospora alba]TDP70844.1 hypothetical protein C8E96_6474 [Actinokineospora alba]SDJ17842.1 hypothetical protein SAMN05421871_110326 [Actinokineospora alba]SDP59925.1 hypothetical protein SAMN05192558_110326 [Actinokineospora alba]